MITTNIPRGKKGNTFWHFVRSFALADTSRHSWVWLLSFCQKVTSEKLWSESIDVLYIRRCHLYSALRKFDNFLGILFYKRLSLFLRGGVCVMMTIARYKRHENGLCAKQTKETFFSETFLNVASLPVCTPSICQVCLALPLLDVITHCLKKQHQCDCQTQSYCQLDNRPALLVTLDCYIEYHK